MLTCLAKDLYRRGTCADKVTHRFMGAIRHPNRGQYAGTVQLGQHHRVTTVSLYPVSRLHRYQRRRHDNVVVSQRRQLPIQVVAARACFITEAEPRPGPAKLLCQLGDLSGGVRNVAHRKHLTATLTFRGSNRQRRLMDIQSHINGILHQARSPCLRLGTGPPGATLDRSLSWSGPHVTSSGEHTV